ncbi:MBL fold metallo-hydrolase [uncultured Roseobacter sp.]|uniref:ComEC/Rec2 family competence protein n=1 Tax=uncultured Roseobacter sp. TaxID=114847 RepID=UPI00261F0A21|nr:MBL fold metallo-hydrolase [uncultured Roseobacter sp.]
MTSTTEAASVYILDVGHGNSSIVRSSGECAVVDSPLGSSLKDSLDELQITRLKALIVSHSDRDHIAGILAVLTDPNICVERIYINPDSPKRTKIWGDLLAALRVAEREDKTEIVNSLSVSTPGNISVGDVNLKVVGPVASLAVAGVGGRDEKNRRITSNSLSSVIRVEGPNGATVLLAGDVDATGLEPILHNPSALSADVLVYPHHGGFAGPATAEDAFVSTLLNASKPKRVVFSNGFGVHDNPRPHVVASVVNFGCAVACTQLSNRCFNKPQGLPDDHLLTSLSKGSSRGVSCAGTMLFEVGSAVTATQGNSEGHDAFVSDLVPTPMCRIATNG